MHGNMVDLEIRNNLRRKKLYRMNQGSNFIESSFSNRDNVRALIQFKDRAKLFTEIHTVLELRTQLNLCQKFQWKYLKILIKVKESQRKQTCYKRSNKCIHKSSLF